MIDLSLPIIIFDAETNGLLRDVTKVHCVSYQVYFKREIVETESLVDTEDIKKLFRRKAVFLGHNIIRYDFPVFFKVLQIPIPEFVIDTLGLSWYLYPNLKEHGLEAWGRRLGIEKPPIKDWKDLEIEMYIFRCEEDVKINVELFKKQFTYLNEIYLSLENMSKIIDYLNFKLDCLREQEEEGITLDEETCKKNLEVIREAFNAKRDILSAIMPPELGKIIKSRPKVPFKQDGTLSHYGDLWFNYLRENNLPFDIECVRELPNPGSTPQLIQWLFSLGWKPATFKVSKSTGKRLPQVSLPFGQGLCHSVKALYNDYPRLKELEDYYMLRHRKGLLKSFLKEVVDGRVKASAHGLTNTLRLAHKKPIANLPKPSVSYGREIRECLTVPDDSYLMCGSDVSSLEDSTKQHYIYYYDPKYVEDMRIPGFDPHIDIGVLAGLISKEEEAFYKWADAQKNLTPEESSKFSQIKKVRGISKTANFAATYGAGGPKIAETAKIPVDEGYTLHKIYWKRNAAIKQIEKDVTVKVVDGQAWLYNPISGFWIFLKAQKDRFSTLNQNTGVFVFDCWLRKVRAKLKSKGIPVVLQYHDEILLVFKKGHRDFVTSTLRQAMKEVNEMLNLNVEIGISVDYGNNYAVCH